MLNRLKNSKGFTLSETMASVLILILVITIIGGGVVVVKNAYQRITLKANAQTLMSTTITKVTDEFEFAENITEGTDNPYFVSGNSKFKIAFKNGTGNEGVLQSYKYGDNTKTTPLLSSKTMTDGLVPTITYSYNKDLFTATVTVSKDGDPVSTQTFSVKPINN